MKEKDTVSKKEKRKIDKTKLATKIIAGFMCALMIGSILYTFVYYMIRLASQK